MQRVVALHIVMPSLGRRLALARPDAVVDRIRITGEIIPNVLREGGRQEGRAGEGRAARSTQR
jgi:hypothetical protein